MTRAVLTFLCLVATCFGAGCQRPAIPIEPTSASTRVADYEAFVDRTLTLLRERDFTPQTVDRQRGLIVTRPTVCRQWYEIWRDDPQDAYHVIESSLHTVRSIVTIRIERGSAVESFETALSPAKGGSAPSGEASSQPSGEEIAVSVEVEKSRFSTPERQVTTASGAIAIYSERIPTAEGLRKSNVALSHWVSLGRDGDYERHLLAAILKHE
ncbi:MAG: hypothetical protein JNG88_16240 [Phycisphaerales bacterium]|nr:hypothetical protein [Phycisphaerales bacterium]